MPAQIFGAPATAIQLYQAFFGAAPSNPLFSNYTQVITASSPIAFALTLGNQFATVSDADLAARVLTNLGITSTTVPAASYTALLSALTQAFAAFPTQRGIVVNNLTNILTGLENDVTFGSVAQVFNQSVTASYIYASNTANTTTQTIGGITTTTPLSVNAGDVVTGTSGNDNINGNLFYNQFTGGLVQTLQTGDSVNGGAGTDTLTLGLNATLGGATVTPTLTSIENISVVQQTAAVAMNLVNSTGVTALSFANTTGAGDLTLSNIGAVLTSVSMNNALGDLIVGHTATAIAGTADAIAVNMTQVGDPSTTPVTRTLLGLTGYETINVTSAGPATNVVALADAAATTNYTVGATVNVTGDRTLDLSTGGSTNAIIVNASGMTGTGALLLTAGSAGTGNNVNVTGSANADTVTLGGSYTTADTVNGGAGSDTLSVTSAIATSTQANQSNLSNMEVLSVSTAVADATTITPASWGGATTLTLGAGTAGTLAVNFAAGTGTLNLGATATGGLTTVTASGSSLTDVLNVNAGTSTSGSLVNAGITTVQYETVNLASNAGLGNTNTFGAITMSGTASVETLNISGARTLTLGAVTADVVNASAMTASLVMGAASISASVPASGLQITGGSAADTLFGAAGADVINGGAGGDRLIVAATNTANQGDILTGGDGADQFRFQGDTIAAITAMSSSAPAGSLAQVVRITDFVAGTDKIALVTGAGGAVFTAVNMNAARTVATASTLAEVYAAANASGGLAAVAGSTAATAQAMLITVSAGTQAGTYLYINDATAGFAAGETDMLINISGVSGTVSASDFTLTGA